MAKSHVYSLSGVVEVDSFWRGCFQALSSRFFFRGESLGPRLHCKKGGLFQPRLVAVLEAGTCLLLVLILQLYAIGMTPVAIFICY